MAGYTRQDTSNNISNGNVIDADDFDAEYNAVEVAFNATAGHKHDGTTGEGAPITKLGPSQDLIISGTQVLPKVSNTLDLGSAAVQFKDGFFDGTVDTDELTVSGNTTVGGSLSVTGGTVSDLTGDVTGDLTGDVTGTVSDISNHTTDDLAEGTSNQYFTTSRSRTAISAAGPLSYNATTGVMSYTQGNTDTVAEGTSNLYFTDARAKASAKGAISVTDVGGDGSLSYNNGVITYTGPSANEARAHFTAGNGIAISSGQISTNASDTVSFANMTISGNLNVLGTTTSVNTSTSDLTDTFLVLNSDETEAPSVDAGITVERGTAPNKSFYWDESADKWSVGAETIVATNFEGNATTATSLATSRTIQLTGDVTGSTTFNGAANATISVAIVDDSHNHTIANVDGLQTALNGKASSAQGALANSAVQPNDNVTLGTVSATSVSASTLSGTLNSSNLTGSLPAVSGAALTGMYGVGGTARGFIAFNGATGAVIRSRNVTLSKSSTGNYTLTMASSVRTDGSNWVAVVGSVDEGVNSQASVAGTGGNTEIYNTYVSARSNSTITLRSRNYFTTLLHQGGNDNNSAYSWGIRSVDPTYIAVVIY